MSTGDVEEDIEPKGRRREEKEKKKKSAKEAAMNFCSPAVWTAVNFLGRPTAGTQLSLFFCAPRASFLLALPGSSARWLPAGEGGKSVAGQRSCVIGGKRRRKTSLPAYPMAPLQKQGPLKSA